MVLKKGIFASKDRHVVSTMEKNRFVDAAASVALEAQAAVMRLVGARVSGGASALVDANVGFIAADAAAASDSSFHLTELEEYRGLIKLYGHTIEDDAHIVHWGGIYIVDRRRHCGVGKR